jgi:hypothetical protein
MVTTKLVMYGVHAYLLMTLLFKGIHLRGVFDRIGKEGCSDPYTNRAFQQFDDEIVKHCIHRCLTALIVVVGIIICVFLMESCCHCLWLLKCDFKTVCTQWRRQKNFDHDRQNSALHTSNKPMGILKAPG